MSHHSSPIDKVAANDDILTEILIKLPVKSLLQFKSVSKHWLSLITNPHFAHCRNPNSSSVSGLFLYSSMRCRKPKLNFIPLQNDGSPTDDDNDAYLTPLTTIPGLKGKGILSSCHGLLCCSCYSNVEGDYQLHYYILNPTTKQFKSLPQPSVGKGVSLAFDPSRSPHYKAVCVGRVDSVLSSKSDQNELCYQIEIYSSETGSWRACTQTFKANRNTQFLGGVYWNGAINWFNTLGDCLYFNVEEERIGTIPLPPVPQGDWKGRLFRYYGESNDHLHLVEIYGPMTQFDVYEMERDYSGWFVKYRVDLDAVGSAFPEMMQTLLWEPTYYSFAILSIVRGEKDEDSFMVLHIPGKIIRYNFVNKSFKKICEVGAEHCDGNGMMEDCLRNDFIFNGTPVDPLAVLHGVRLARNEFGRAISLGAANSFHYDGVENQGNLFEWQPPSGGGFKINCDVATSKKSNRAALVVCLRNSRGSLLDGRVCFVSISSACQGEALACRLACCLARTLNLSSVEIESDNTTVIHLCVSETVPPWDCAAIIGDIRTMAAENSFRFSWCSRKANRVAHWVAKAFLRGSLPCDWVSCTPLALSSLLF